MKSLAMEGHGISSSRGALDEYMNFLSDIRRSTAVICDSIRTRERTALSLLGVATDNLDGVKDVDSSPVRCPICMEEFADPSVAITVCGHGMHKDCMSSHLQHNDDGSPGQVFSCPLCKARFRKTDILRLIGLHPPTGQSAVWRSIQLCTPWKVEGGKPSSSEAAKASPDALPEHLYISLKSLFRQTNELSRAFDSILHLHDEAAELRSDAAEENRKAMDERNDAKAAMLKKDSDLDKKWQARMLRLEVREKRLISSEFQNEAFIGQCVKAVKREEASNLEILRSIVGKQKRLDRTNMELFHRHEMAESSIRALESRKWAQEENLKTKERNVDSEGRLGSPQRNQQVSNNRQQIADMRNPSFSTPETSENNSTDEVDVVRVDDDSASPKYRLKRQKRS